MKKLSGYLAKLHIKIAKKLGKMPKNYRKLYKRIKKAGI